MKRIRNKLPWYLLAAVVLLATIQFFRGLNNIHRLAYQNLDYSMYVYTIAEAAAHGNTNGVMKVLTQVHSDSSNSISRILEACDKNRTLIMELHTANKNLEPISGSQ